MLGGEGMPHMGLRDLLARDASAEVSAARRYALVLTRARDEAEDLVQEALTSAIRSSHTWRPESDLRRWLLAIVHNTYLKRRRQQQLERAATEHVSWATAAALPPAQPSRVELSQTIAAMMTLPEEQRAALVLVAFDGVTYRDAAIILGVPVGTLMSRLARGREALRAATGRPARAGPAPMRLPLRIVD